MSEFEINMLFWGYFLAIAVQILDLYFKRVKYSNFPNGNWFKSKGPFLLIIAYSMLGFTLYDFFKGFLLVNYSYVYFMLLILVMIFMVWGSPKNPSKALSSKQIGSAIKFGIEIDRIVSGKCPECNRKIGYLKSRCPYCTARL